MRALLVVEAELGEHITRARILRRVALIQAGHGGPLIIGDPEAGPADLPLVIVPTGEVLRNPSIGALGRALGLVGARQLSECFDEAIVGAGPEGLSLRSMLPPRGSA